jgi:ubiquinone/menaquinone biosynthesis C-methylase UbiE
VSVRDAFDEFAAAGRDREMEAEHWPTAKEALSRMPIDAGDAVLDLGTGSGYAARALSEAADAGRAVGLDAAPAMASAASARTDDPAVEFVAGDFHDLPFESDSFDHCFSMEAFFFATDPSGALGELRRVLRPGATFYCGVNFYQANHYSHEWADRLDPEMLLWSADQYRSAFRDAGFHVASQDRIPDRETEIPPEDAFPTDAFESREAMVERYRELGTLLTVGVAP